MSDEARSPSEVTEDLAARTITQVLESTGWLPSRVVVFHRGEDPLWQALERALEDGGCSVELVECAASDTGARLEHAVGGEGVVLVHHEPLRFAPGPGFLDVVRERLREGCRVVHLEFPVRQTHPRSDLRAAYLRALGAGSADVRAYAGEICARLGRASALELVAGDAVLHVPGPFRVLDDFTVLQVDEAPQVLQLPLGEVWALVDESRAHGRAEIDAGGGRTVAVDVRDGTVDGAVVPPGRLVEIGFGANRSAPRLPTVLAEKAAGTVHLGFGDSTMLGGGVHGEQHSDLVLSARTRWMPRG